MELTLISLAVFGILLGAITVRAIVSSEADRPEGRIPSFRTRYIPSVWSEVQMDHLIQTFHDTWLKHYRTSPRKVRRVLNNTNILWQERRWEVEGKPTAAQVSSRTDLLVWRGPRIRKDEYRFNYTAIVPGLIQLLVFRLDGRELTFEELQKEYGSLIFEIADELRKVENAKQRQISRESPRDF